MAKAKKEELIFAPPRSDAYTGILVISFLALVGGSVFLYLDWNYYKGSKPPDAPSFGQMQSQPPVRPPVVPPGGQMGGAAGVAGQMGGAAGVAGQMGVPPPMPGQAGVAGAAGVAGVAGAAGMRGVP